MIELFALSHETQVHQFPVWIKKKQKRNQIQTHVDVKSMNYVIEKKCETKEGK